MLQYLLQVAFPVMLWRIIFIHSFENYIIVSHTFSFGLLYFVFIIIYFDIFPYLRQRTSPKRYLLLLGNSIFLSSVKYTNTIFYLQKTYKIFISTLVKLNCLIIFVKQLFTFLKDYSFSKKNILYYQIRHEIFQPLKA